MRHLEPDPQLESIARTSLRFLFVDHGAQVFSNELLPGIGNSQVFIRVLDMEFRIIQSGGSLAVFVAPCHARDNWQRVESILIAIDEEHNLPPSPVYGSLADLGGLLEPQLTRLNDALSRERFASTVETARRSKMRDLIALKPSATVQPSTTRRYVAAVIQGIAKAVQFLTPRPKDSHAKFLPIGSDDILEQQVRQEFDSLFRHFGAQINSNGRLAIMDFATVTFDVGTMRVSASRDRGSVSISLAPIHFARDSHSLGVVVQALSEDEGAAQIPFSSNLRGAGKLIETHFVKLNDAFSDAKYPMIRKRIIGISEALKQKWMEEFNQKSRNYKATMA